MATMITLPGIGGSGKTHWQTLWEARDPQMARFRPASWDAPDRDDWADALDRAVHAASEPPILIAHSLACLLVAHWAARTPDAGKRIRGALLVAVPDPSGPAFPVVEAASFMTVPEEPLPFPTLVVASVDDPYGDTDQARRRAEAWGAGLVVAGALGHINGASGIGDWPLGAQLLEAFRAGTRTPATPWAHRG